MSFIWESIESGRLLENFIKDGPPGAGLLVFQGVHLFMNVNWICRFEKGIQFNAEIFCNWHQ